MANVECRMPNRRVKNAGVFTERCAPLMLSLSKYERSHRNGEVSTSFSRRALALLAAANLQREGRGDLG